MVENKSSLFGIIALIIGATGLGVGVFSVVSFQMIEGPQGLPGDDGQDGIDGKDALGGILVAILEPHHGEIVTGKKIIRTLVTGSEGYTISILRNGTEIGASSQLDWDTSTVNDGWWNITVIATDIQTSAVSSDVVIVHVKNSLIEYPCSSEVEVRDALDAIGQGYGIITIINDITLSNTINISGGGIYIIQGLIRAEEPNKIISVDCGGDRTAFNITNSTSCTIKDMEIDATDITSQTTIIIDINETNNRPIYIDNVQIIGDNANFGRVIYIQSNGVWIYNCYIYNFYEGIWQTDEGNNAYIQDNILVTCFFYGIVCFGDYNTIEHNYIDGSWRGAILMEGHYNMIKHNEIYFVFSDDASGGIKITGGEFNMIMGNNIDLDNPTSHPGSCIYLYDGADYNFVIDNLCFNSYWDYGEGFGIRIGGPGETYTCNANCIFDNSIIGIGFPIADNGVGTDISGNDIG